MAPNLTVSCGCPSPGMPLLRELRGVVGVIACSGCGAELLVRLGAPPSRQCATARVDAQASPPRPAPRVQAEGFARLLASGRPDAHDAFVRSSFEHGRLAAAAACYRPLLEDPVHGLVAARAMRQIAALALVPTMAARAGARTPSTGRRKLLGHLVLVLAGFAILRLQMVHWQERISDRNAALAPARRARPQPSLRLPEWPPGGSLAMGHTTTSLAGP